MNVRTVSSLAKVAVAMEVTYTLTQAWESSLKISHAFHGSSLYQAVIQNKFPSSWRFAHDVTNIQNLMSQLKLIPRYVNRLRDQLALSLFHKRINLLRSPIRAKEPAGYWF